MSIVDFGPMRVCIREGAGVQGRTTRLLQNFVLFSITLSIATGCNAMSDANHAALDAFKPMQSVKEAEAQLSAWIIPGVAVAEAVDRLTLLGFNCQAARPSAPYPKAAMHCIYQTSPPPPPEVRRVAPLTPVTWIVTLNSEDGAEISSFQASRSPKDIGE